MKSFLLGLAVCALLGLAESALARVDVLFHPHDPTLETIAQWIEEAESTVDISMYNMETTSGSPIIQTLQSKKIQDRLQSGALTIRMTLELYGSPEENKAKRQTLEDLGIDVRFLGRSVKAHHKFAVIDANGPHDRVITGSANWSLSSYRGYNENILFFTQEPEATSRYQQEFNRVWNASKEFGSSKDYVTPRSLPMTDQNDLEVYFNSPRTLDKASSESSNLTQEIVNLINNAESTLQIATTRIRLLPVLEALQSAAERGVKIQAVISQDDFRDLGRRFKYLNHDNIDLRVKFYNLDLSEYMRFQMHNKFMIVDREILVTGSFNWSESSEKNHIENLAVLSGEMAQDVLPDYQREFAMIWNLGRDEYPTTYESLKSKRHQECAIPQMALYPQEIRQLLKHSPCK